MSNVVVSVLVVLLSVIRVSNKDLAHAKWVLDVTDGHSSPSLFYGLGNYFFPRKDTNLCKSLTVTVT